MDQKKKHTTGLGRGLDALISLDEVKTAGSSTISEIALSKIVPNPDQPRKEFDEEALQELADSVRTYGVIQPITVHKTADGNYQIISGERRWRASAKAGLKTIPAYVRDVDDNNVLEMALVENVQRSDLNPMEIALGYKAVMEVKDLTQEELSERVGKNRATIANYLRLFKLPGEIQLALQKKEIDMGHARALLALDNPVEQLQLFHEIRENGYSVRKVEELVKAASEKKDAKPATRKTKTAAPAPDFDMLKQHLSSFFGTNVQLSCNAGGKGKISIPFKDEKELERIIALFDKMKN